MHDIHSALEYEHAADAHAARAEHVRQLREAVAAGRMKDTPIYESSLIYPFLLLPFGAFLAWSGWHDARVPHGLALGMRVVGPIVAGLVVLLLLRYLRRVMTLTAEGVVAADDTLLPWHDMTGCEVVPTYSGPFTAFTAIVLIHRAGCTMPVADALGRIARLPPRADGAEITRVSLFAKARLISESRLFDLFDKRIRAAHARRELQQLGLDASAETTTGDPP